MAAYPCVSRYIVQCLAPASSLSVGDFSQVPGLRRHTKVSLEHDAPSLSGPALYALYSAPVICYGIVYIFPIS